MLKIPSLNGPDYINPQLGALNMFTYQTEVIHPVTTDKLQILVERVFSLLGFVDNTEETTRIDQKFSELLDSINRYELSAILTARVIDDIENLLLDDTELMTLVLNMNSCLAFIISDEERDLLLAKIQNLVNSMSSDSYTDTILSNSGAYINQLNPVTKLKNTFIVNSYYKIIVLLAIYSFEAISSLVN